MPETTGEESLAPPLLLGGCWITLAAVAGRARLAAARARLTRRARPPRDQATR